jgi:F0F1-type ATP synthase gamma subunit
MPWIHRMTMIPQSFWCRIVQLMQQLTARHCAAKGSHEQQPAMPENEDAVFLSGNIGFCGFMNNMLRSCAQENASHQQSSNVADTVLKRSCFTHSFQHDYSRSGW